MFAAVVGGEYATVEEAIESMESGFECEYTPDGSRAVLYSSLYERYERLGGFVETETLSGRGRE
jgi:L-ribulokinase